MPTNASSILGEPAAGSPRCSYAPLGYNHEKYGLSVFFISFDYDVMLIGDPPNKPFHESHLHYPILDNVKTWYDYPISSTLPGPFS